MPQDLQGRVGGVYRTAVFGGLVVGTTVGGVLAQHYGVSAPRWFAFTGSAVFVPAIWGRWGTWTGRGATGSTSPIAATGDRPS